jgi:hypothetical protein
MTEHEQLMYQILGKISEADAPIVFKGALITKLVLAENGFTMLDRKTADIDANWIGTPPTMETLATTIQNALGDMQNQLYAAADRQYGERKSAGISIRTKETDEEIVSMDISMKPVMGSRIYHYGEISIRGVLPNEILTDKITVLSKRLVFRRSKDLVDVYALTHCVKVLTAKIFGIISRKHLELGEFTDLLTRRADVEHAYNMLKGIDGKPPFDDVYAYLTKFVQPFSQRDKTPRVWSSRNQVWDDSSRSVKKIPIKEQLRAAQQEADRDQASKAWETKRRDEQER